MVQLRLCSVELAVNAVIPAGFPNKDATFVLVLQLRSGNPCDVITALFPSFGTVRLLSATIIILS